MGLYLNPDVKAFADARSSEIYVDKSELIGYLNTIVNTNQKCVSVSRPRRFGKTMAVNMICAYYDRKANARVLFENSRLAACGGEDSKNQKRAWDEYLGSFNCIKVVMTDFIKRDRPVRDSLELLSRRVLRDLSREYPDTEYDEDDLAYSMNQFYHDSGIPFVIVIDEWDAVFRIRKSDKDGQTEYLDFLRDWLKDQSCVALAYMTGILPIKKYGEHSALNMFDEYSMTAPMQLAPYTGFTDEEVSELCKRYGRNYDAVRDWYDGYTVSDIIPADPGHRYLKENGTSPRPHIYSIYSPLSVVKAMRNGLIQNYWNSTESYEALAEYIRMDFDGLKREVALLMDGGRVKVSLSTYQNDMTTFRNRDDILALLIHLGYLGYDSMTGEVFIPNKEVLDVFKDSTGSDDWSPTFQSFRKSQELLQATWNMDENETASLLEWFHDQISNKTYNDEAALSYSIQMAYYAAQKYYTAVQELDTGKGYADIVYIPSPGSQDKPVMIIELKYNQDDDTAMNQIRKRNYPQRLEKYKGNILLVGINYSRDVKSTDPEFKHHSCIIERA